MEANRPGSKSKLGMQAHPIRADDRVSVRFEGIRVELSFPRWFHER